MSAASFQAGAWFTSSYPNGGPDCCVEINHSRPDHSGSATGAGVRGRSRRLAWSLSG